MTTEDRTAAELAGSIRLRLHGTLEDPRGKCAEALDELELRAGALDQPRLPRTIFVKVATDLLPELAGEESPLVHITVHRDHDDTYELVLRRPDAELSVIEPETRLERAIAILREIAGEDYRGNRPASATKAQRALEELGALEESA